MKRCFAIVGIILSSVCIASAQETAKPLSLYESILRDVTQEFPEEFLPPETTDFVLAVMREKGTELTARDIQDAVTGKRSTICAKLKDYGRCEVALIAIRALVTDTVTLRNAGRTLQAIASSYEVPTHSLPGALHDASGYRGILDLWKVTGSPVESDDIDSPVRIVAFPPMESERSALKDALLALPPEERTAAIWHYLHGVQFARGERANTKGVTKENADDTERQYRFRSVASVEDILLRIATLLRQRADALTPPLTEGEIALFVPPLAIDDHVIVWGRSDDVGLQFSVPTDPVLPSLVGIQSKRPILGGLFPPPPGDGKESPAESSGICSHPIADDGYLCSALPATATACSQTPEPDPERIVLTRCDSPTRETSTLAGPDICATLPWHDNSAFDPMRQCRVSLSCEATCDNATSEESWHTSMKGEDGSIEVCLKNRGAIPPAYGALEGLSFAHALCNLPPATPPPDSSDPLSCCAFYAPGAAAMCEAMAQDGLFQGSDPPMTIPLCVDASINASCRTTCNRAVPANVADTIASRARDNAQNLGNPCDATADERITLLQQSLEKSTNVCDGAQTLRFHNTIGNQLCFAGSCLEESLESHRIVPSRNPKGTGNEAFPYDANLALPSDIGTLRTLPVSPPPVLPSYRPAALAHSFDTALCQLSGLPASALPSLCSFDPTRRFALPLDSFLSMARDLTEQKLQVASPAQTMERLATAYGAKIGSALYSRAFDRMGRTLTDAISTINVTLSQMRSTTFPAEMCPLGEGADASSDADL